MIKKKFTIVTLAISLIGLGFKESLAFEGWDGESISAAEDIYDNERKNTYPILEGVEEQKPTPGAQMTGFAPEGVDIGMLDLGSVVGNSGMMEVREINGKRYYYWNQGDFGGVIRSLGCGPTSMAIILSNLTGKPVSPRKMWNISVNAGVSNGRWGSNGNGLASILNGYGVRTRRTFSHEEARRHLQSGGQVLASVGGSDTYSNMGRYIAPWHHYRAGHFVVYTELTSSGGYVTLDPGWRQYTGVTSKGLVKSSTKAYWLLN